MYSTTPITSPCTNRSLYDLLLAMFDLVAWIATLDAALVRDTLALGEGGARGPVDALGGAGDLVVELVDLLEREALGLINKKVDEGDAQEAAREPDEEDLGLQVRVPGAVVHEVRGRVGDCPVQEPL